MKIITCWLIHALIFGAVATYAQSEHYANEMKGQNSTREHNRERRKLVYKSIKPHFILSIDCIYSFLDTDLAFASQNNRFGTRISLENDLGLSKTKLLPAAAIIFRISRRSGLYATYYGLKRETSKTIKLDIPYLEDTLKIDTKINSYFTTNMVSIGYLFSILEDDITYLAAYLNLTMMGVRTGVQVNGTFIDQNIQLYAPLPTIGIVGAFQIKPWFSISGDVGTFSIKTSDFRARLNNASIRMGFRTTNWMQINVGYYSFYLNTTFYKDKYNIIVDYNFRGPSLGLSFQF